MADNVIERAITPYNPSSASIINRERYMLYAPVASTRTVGMAKFDSRHFFTKNGEISLKSGLILSTPIIRVRKEENLLEIDTSMYEDISFVQFVPYVNGKEIPLRIAATEKYTTFDLNIIEEEFAKGINTITVIAIPDPVNEAVAKLYSSSTVSNTVIIETGHEYLDGYWLMNNDIDLLQFYGLEEEVSFKCWGVTPNGDGGTVFDKIEITDNYVYGYYTNYSGEYRKTSLYDNATNYWSGGFNSLWFDRAKVSERLYRFVTSNGSQNYEFVEEVESAIENLDREIEQLYMIADELVAINETTAKRVDFCEKRIKNLEKGLPDDRFVTDDSVAYVKRIPTNACPYAAVEKVGGMTKKSGNLIPFPYYTASQTINGVTFTVQDNGSIIVNGTATANTRFDLMGYGALQFKAGEYHTLTGCPQGGSNNTYRLTFSGDPGGEDLQDIGNGYTKQCKTDANLYGFYIYIASGFTAKNLVFLPKLEVSASPTPYEKKYDGIRTSKVTAIESKDASGNIIGRIDIPTEVQNLDCYGEGAGTASNGIVWREGGVFFEKRCKKITLTADKSIYRDAYAPNFRLGFNIADKVPSVGFVGNMASNIAVKADPITTPAQATEYSIAGSNTAGAVYVIVPNCTNATDAIAYLNAHPIELWYETTTPETIDISDLITADNLIEVEGGGTLTFVNEYGAVASSTIEYQVKGAS